MSPGDRKQLAAAVAAGAAVAAFSTRGKTQNIRLVDVFALGPFLIWTAASSGRLPAPARLVLAASGAATIVFNGLNWLEIQRGAGERKD